MHYTEEVRSQIITRYKNKESVINISKETCIPRSTIYRWINDYTAKTSIPSNVKNKEIKELEARWKNCKPCWLLFISLEFLSMHR